MAKCSSIVYWIGTVNTKHREPNNLSWKSLNMCKIIHVYLFWPVFENQLKFCRRIRADKIKSGNIFQRNDMLHSFSQWVYWLKLKRFIVSYQQTTKGLMYIYVYISEFIYGFVCESMWNAIDKTFFGIFLPSGEVLRPYNSKKMKHGISLASIYLRVISQKKTRLTHMTSGVKVKTFAF